MAAALLRRRSNGPRLHGWAAARLPAVREFDGDEPTRQRSMLARRSITKPDELAYFLASAPLDATVADLDLSTSAPAESGARAGWGGHTGATVRSRQVAERAA